MKSADLFSKEPDFRVSKGGAASLLGLILRFLGFILGQLNVLETVNLIRDQHTAVAALPNIGPNQPRDTPPFEIQASC